MDAPRRDERRSPHAMGSWPMCFLCVAAGACGPRLGPEVLRQALDAGPCASVVEFSDDFESGGFTAWQGLNHRADGGAGEQLQIVDAGSAPVRTGHHAARFIVRPGDAPFVASSEQASLLRSTGHGGDGDEYYLAWSTWFPATWAPTSALRILKIEDGSGRGPCEVYVNGDSVYVRTSASDDAAAPNLDRFNALVPDRTLTLGAWHDFVLHLRWSQQGDAGLTEGWHRSEGSPTFTPAFSDRAQTLNRFTDGGGAAPTLYFGILRGPAPGVDMLIHDDVRYGPTFCSVAQAFPEQTAPDGGAELDGGRTDAHPLAVGCGCGARGGPLLAALACAPWLLRRRRSSPFTAPASAAASRTS